MTQPCPAPKLHAGPWVLNLHLLQTVLFFFFPIPDLSCPTSHLRSEIPTCGARGMSAWPLSRSSPCHLPFPCTVVQDGRVHLLGQVGSRPRNFLRTGSRGRGWGQGSRGGRSAPGRRLPAPHVLLGVALFPRGSGKVGGVDTQAGTPQAPPSFQTPPHQRHLFLRFGHCPVRPAPRLPSRPGFLRPPLCFCLAGGPCTPRPLPRPLDSHRGGGGARVWGRGLAGLGWVGRGRGLGREAEAAS